MLTVELKTEVGGKVYVVGFTCDDDDKAQFMKRAESARFALVCNLPLYRAEWERRMQAVEQLSRCGPHGDEEPA